MRGWHGHSKARTGLLSNGQYIPGQMNAQWKEPKGRGRSGFGEKWRGSFAARSSRSMQVCSRINMGSATFSNI